MSGHLTGIALGCGEGCCLLIKKYLASRSSAALSHFASEVVDRVLWANETELRSSQGLQLSLDGWKLVLSLLAW